MIRLHPPSYHHGIQHQFFVQHIVQSGHLVTSSACLDVGGGQDEATDDQRGHDHGHRDDFGNLDGTRGAHLVGLWKRV